MNSGHVSEVRTTITAACASNTVDVFFEHLFERVDGPRGTRLPRCILLMPAQRVPAYLHRIRLRERNRQIRIGPTVREATVAMNRTSLHHVARYNHVEFFRNNSVVRCRVRTKTFGVHCRANRASARGGECVQRHHYTAQDIRIDEMFDVVYRSLGIAIFIA